MEQEKIIEKIEEIYNSKNKEGKPTGKNFITHMIKAYLPIGKTQKLWESPKKNLKCAITGQGVCSVDDAFKALHSEGMDVKLVEHLSNWAKGEGVSEHPLTVELKGRVIGWTGKKTDTVLCLAAAQAFFIWVQTKILNGDKHIRWVLADMKRKETINVIKQKLPSQEDQENIKVLERVSKKPKRATMSLGDLSALQNLKVKLEEQEKNETNKQ